MANNNTPWWRDILATLASGHEPGQQQLAAAADAALSASMSARVDAEARRLAQIGNWLRGCADGTMRVAKLRPKLLESLSRLEHSSGAKAPSPQAEVAQVAEATFGLVVDPDVDLGLGREFLTKCAEIHTDDLLALEQAALRWESGDPEAADLINRVLHTLKGDFGVMGVMSLSGLIHEVEEAILRKAFGAEQLLKLKDFLLEVFVFFSRGDVPKLTSQLVESIFQCAKHNPEPQPSTPSPVDAQVEAVLASPITPAPQEEHPLDVREDYEAMGRSLSEDPTLLADFITESKEALEQAVPALLEMEDGDLDTVNLLFRVAHTMKGLCGFLGFSCLGGFTHQLENVLAAVRKGDMKLEVNVVDVLRESFDLLYEMVLAVERALAGDTLAYPAHLRTVYAKLVVLEDTCIAVVENATPHRPVAELSVPSADAVSVIQSQLVEEDARSTSDAAELSPEIVATPAQREPGAQKMTVDEMIRVSTKKLDQLIDTIGETVIAQSMIVADQNIVALHDLLLEKKLAQGNLLLRQVQELSMSLRMVPILGVFQKMSRAVRDLSKKMGKQVRLVTVGDETELDKGIVEQISDPIMHMVRNAMDHGLEMPEERKNNGKSEQSTIWLRAFNRSGAIVIEIEDDGRGLDMDRILAKAVAQGLCSSDAQLSDQDIFRFIFHPGFSTAAKVTDLSGRGVGMDVVKKNIEALRGSIVIHSEKGKGTLFSIRLPLTLAIIDGMVVRCDEHRFILPTLSIVQSLRCEHERQLLHEPDGTVLFQFLGSMIPLVGISQLLGMSIEAVQVADHVIMIVEDMEGHRLGLVVDEILGQQQIVIKGLGPWIGSLAGVAGGTIMNDGTISLILDVPELMRLVEQNAQALSLVVS